MTKESVPTSKLLLDNLEKQYGQFLRDDFTVDDYIKNHASLEQLRQDLAAYLRTCRLALVDLINDNYADFIGLADGMVGLDSGIKKLITPLESFKGNITKVEADYNAIIGEISSKMAQVEAIRNQREQIESIIHVYDNLQVMQSLCDSVESASQDNGSEPDIYSIERLAIQINEINSALERYSASLKSSPFIEGQLQPKCKGLSKRIRNILETAFNHSLSHSNGFNLQRLYKIYSINGQLSNLERILLAKIRPHFISIISDSRLEACGVDKFFLDLKSLLLKHLKAYVSLEAEGRTWFLSRIWSELVSVICIQSPTLFASGNPDQFLTNYLACSRFLQSLQSELEGDGKALQDVDLSLLTHKFNISVYFRIRFQEIASQFEQSLKQSYTYQPQESKKFRIQPLEVLIESLKTCWSKEKVYLDLLFPNFWKLTLQLASRCAMWLRSIELSQLEIENVTFQESARLKCSLLSAFFSQTEQAILDIRTIYKTMILPLKPDWCDERQLKESLEDGLLAITETGLPNIVKLTKQCLVKRGQS